MIDGQKRELLQIAERVQMGLTQLGHCFELKKTGVKVGVSFAGLALADDGNGGPADFGLLEIDMLALPPRVDAHKLTRPQTLHHLAAVVGRPLYNLNTSGITYVVDLRPARTRRVALPDSVALDVSADAAGPALILGRTLERELLVNPERLQNVLVVGAQGTGKSAFLRLLTYQAIKRGWRLGLADPDLATFNPDLWRGAECLVGGNVATSPKGVGQLFGVVLSEIERRADLFQNAPGYPDSLSEYNATARQPLPRLAVVVDEANTFLSDRTLVEQAADLARRARKWGLHCVFAGHNWRASDIPRGLSAMLQTRVAFRVSDDTSGRVVLERDGAETLPAVPGRCIIRLGGEYRLLQAYHLDKRRLVDLVERLPRSEAPGWADLAGEDPDDEQAAMIRQLFDDGLSKRKIQREVFGYTGGAAYTAVSEALESGTTTTE